MYRDPKAAWILEFIKGVGYLKTGIQLILQPGFKRYIIVPIMVNLVLLTTLITCAFLFFSDLLTYATSLLPIPSWLIILLSWLLGIVFFLVSALFSITFFSIITTTLAAPFYGLLSQKVEKKLHEVPEKTHPTSLLKEAIPFVTQTLYRELQKMIHFLPWLLVGLLAFLFPLTLPISALIGLFISAWILSLQYLDYAADNQGIPFKVVREHLKAHRALALGFGTAVTILMGIPILNLIIPPASVAGGTKLWLDLKKTTQNKEVLLN